MTVPEDWEELVEFMVDAYMEERNKGGSAEQCMGWAVVRLKAVGLQVGPTEATEKMLEAFKGLPRNLNQNAYARTYAQLNAAIAAGEIKP